MRDVEDGRTDLEYQARKLMRARQTGQRGSLGGKRKRG